MGALEESRMSYVDPAADGHSLASVVPLRTELARVAMRDAVAGVREAGMSGAAEGRGAVAGAS